MRANASRLTVRTNIHEAAGVLEALHGAARRQLLLVLLVDLGGLAAHLTGTGEGSVDLSCCRSKKKCWFAGIRRQMMLAATVVSRESGRSTLSEHARRPVGRSANGAIPPLVCAASTCTRVSTTHHCNTLVSSRIPGRTPLSAARPSPRAAITGSTFALHSPKPVSCPSLHARPPVRPSVRPSARPRVCTKSCDCVRIRTHS